MNRRTLGVALTTVAVVVAAPAAVSAVTTTTTKPTIQILGGASFETNRFIKDSLRFGKDVYQLKSGVKIKINSKTPDEPHTVSVVSKSDLPKTVAGFDKCYGPGGICGKLSEAHGFPEGPGPPTTPLVNVGAAGFNTKGDSIVIGPGDKDSVDLSAKKGRTLYLLCVIHPWMQAKITVK